MSRPRSAFLPEGPGHPALGIRFATRLPLADNESGLGTDTLEFNVSALVGKTVRSIRVVGNLGMAILGDPTRGDEQGDLMTYGFSLARAVKQGIELVGEINGRYAAERGHARIGEPGGHAVWRANNHRHGASRRGGDHRPDVTRPEHRLHGRLDLGVPGVHPVERLSGVQTDCVASALQAEVSASHLPANWRHTTVARNYILDPRIFATTTGRTRRPELISALVRVRSQSSSDAATDAAACSTASPGRSVDPKPSRRITMSARRTG